MQKVLLVSDICQSFTNKTRKHASKYGLSNLKKIQGYEICFEVLGKIFRVEKIRPEERENIGKIMRTIWS
jgi:hypothetical protein